MGSLPSIAASGLQAAQTRLQASAHNIANLQTDRFQRQQVVQQADAGGGVTSSVTRASQPGPALEQDVVDQLAARNAFLANLAVFRRHDEMLGSLLDTRA